MNAPITSIDLSSGRSDVFALLKILADPAAYKAKLDELIAREDSAKERIAEADAREADTKRLHSTAVATNIVSDRQKATLEKLQAELDDRAQQIEQSEARHSAAELQRRERAADAQEEALKNEAARLSAMRRDLESQLAEIKTLTSRLAR